MAVKVAFYFNLREVLKKKKKSLQILGPAESLQKPKQTLNFPHRTLIFKSFMIKLSQETNNAFAMIYVGKYLSEMQSRRGDAGKQRASDSGSSCRNSIAAPNILRLM